MIARALIALYPLGWRRRYGAEMAALLQDTGVDPRVALSLLAGAAGAHLRPRGWAGLVTPAERMRGTVATVALCWGAVVLAGAGYAKQTEDRPFFLGAHRHVLVGLRDAIAVLAVAGALVVVVCGAPLLFHALAVAWRERRRDLILRLALAPAALVALVVVTALLLAVRAHPIDHSATLAWFALVGIVGLTCAHAPRLVLARSAPPEALLSRALRGAVVLAALMAAIALAVVAYALVLVGGDPGLAAGGAGPLWATTAQALFFLCLLALGGAVAACVSVGRGYRIARG